MKRFKSVQVRDPRTDGYSVVCHPCQDIVLTLSDPLHIFQKACHEDQWEVKTFSEYFYLAEEKKLAGKRQFRFIQYYNLARWTDVSNVYLGDIEVSLVSKELSENYSLCVFAKKNTNKQCRIITAVNPGVNRIKLHAEDILEVVFCKDDPVPTHEEVWCAVYDFGKSGTGNSSQWFERLRQETLILPETAPLRNDRSNLYFTISRDVGCLERNPHLPKNKELPPIPERQVQRQHHFWFRVRPEDKEAVIQANKGDALANVVFNSSRGLCGNLQVLVSQREPKNKPVIRDYDKDRYEGNYRGLVGRYYSPSAGLLVNPGKTEGVELLPKQGGIMVELAPPAMTWPYTDPANRWTCEVEPVMSTADPGSKGKSVRRLSCHEMVDRHINQQTIQRFFIKPECDELPTDSCMSFLGVVNFVCKEPAVIGKRTINCWLVKERSGIEEFDDLGIERYRDLLPLPDVTKRKHSTFTGGVVHSRTRYNEPSKPYRPRIEKIKVQITEECDDGLVTTGCYSQSFSTIKVDKKKEPEVKRITASDYDDFHGISKKKHTSPIHPSNTSGGSPSQRERNTRLCPQFSGSVTADVAANVAVLAQNPAHQDLITLKPGQYAVIRFPITFWELKNDVDYFWCVNPIQIKEQQFFVRDMRIIRQGKRIWQEVVLMLCPNRNPGKVGRHFLGGIRAHNKHSYLFVLVELLVEKETVQNSNPEYSKALRELMEGYRVVKARRDEEEIKAARAYLAAQDDKPQGSLCTLVRDPWPEDRVACVSYGDTLKVSLSKQIMTYPHPVGTSTVELMGWGVVNHPGWLRLRETFDQGKESVFLFDVTDEKAGIIAPLDSIQFYSEDGGTVRNIKVRLEINRLASFSAAVAP